MFAADHFVQYRPDVASSPNAHACRAERIGGRGGIAADAGAMMKSDRRRSRLHSGVEERVETAGDAPGEKRMRRRIDALVRFGALGANHLAERGLSSLARHARQVEIGLDRLAELDLDPLMDIPVPRVDVASTNPIASILSDPIYRETESYFAKHAPPERSLLSKEAQALLYALTRNLRPDHVIEIGVFKGATTEAIARALQLNGHGIVHAVDPYRTEYLQALFSRWPAALARHLSFHARDSIQCASSTSCGAAAASELRSLWSTATTTTSLRRSTSKALPGSWSPADFSPSTTSPNRAPSSHCAILSHATPAGPSVTAQLPKAPMQRRLTTLIEPILSSSAHPAGAF
jgi:hypothetical protein